MNTKFKQARIKSGLTQKHLSEVSGVPYSAITKYESGERDINSASIITVHSLAEAMGCTVYDITDISGNNNRSYVFGSLLAIADMAVQEINDKHKNEISIASEVQNYPKMPYRFWTIIENKIFKTLTSKGDGVLIAKYEALIDKVINRLTVAEFTSKERLKSDYLFYYHQYLDDNK